MNADSHLLTYLLCLLAEYIITADSNDIVMIRKSLQLKVLFDLKRRSAGTVRQSILNVYR